ncbi:MAG: MFS transporter [archaeon]
MHINQHLSFHYLFHKELSELYIAKALRFLALSMVGIFIPVFLYFEIGLTLNQVILYYIIQTITFFFSSFVAAFFMKSIGAKHLILSSVPFLIIMFIFLHYMELLTIFFWLPAIMAGINYGLFWVPFHTEFAKYSDKKHRGREFAFMQALAIFANILGPVIGGIIITYLDYTTLFVIVSILLLGSALPLFLTPELYERYRFSYKALLNPRTVKYGLSFFAEGIKDMTSALVWPLFIFTILGSYVSFGAVSTLSSFAMAAVTLYIGKLTDKMRKMRLIAVGSGLTSIVWFVKTLVRFPLEIFLIDFFNGISNALFHIPYMAKFYDHSSKTDILGFVVFRESMLRLGALAVLMLLLLTQEMIATFVLTGLTSWVHIIL